jgi:hypothetical protein
MRKPTPFEVLYIIAALSVAALFCLYWWSGKDIYTFVTDQGQVIGTLLTGLGGFWGVIFTLKHSADLTRWQGEAALANERNAIRRALAAELSVAADNIDTTEESSKGDPPRVVPSYFEAEAHVYFALQDKLGLLAPQEVEAIVRAYTRYLQLPDTCKRCNEYEVKERSGILKPGSAEHIFYTKLDTAKKCVATARRPSMRSTPEFLGDTFELRFSPQGHPRPPMVGVRECYPQGQPSSLHLSRGRTALGTYAPQ